MSDNRCLLADVRCLIFEVQCLMSDVWCPMSDVLNSMFDFWLPCLMSDVRCLMSDVWCPIFDVRCLTFDIRCLMSDDIVRSAKHLIKNLCFTLIKKFDLTSSTCQLSVLWIRFWKIWKKNRKYQNCWLNPSSVFNNRHFDGFFFQLLKWTSAGKFVDATEKRALKLVK